MVTAIRIIVTIVQIFFNTNEEDADESDYGSVAFTYINS